MKKFKAVIRMGTSGLREVRIEARNSREARELLSAQYGKDKITGDPQEVR